MKKATSYYRCSTDKQDVSIVQQKELIGKYCQEHNITLVKTFQDEGISGVTSEQRPGFMSMIDYIKQDFEDFDYVLVYDQSRFGRFDNPKEAIHWEYEIEKHDKKIIYVSDPTANLEGIGGDITRTVKHHQASEYIKHLRETTMRGEIYLAKQGFHMGSAPYGYDRALINETGRQVDVMKRGQLKSIKNYHVKLVPGDRDRVKTIKEIFNLRAYANMSVREIADHLNKKGIPSLTGKKWRYSVIGELLRNETYVGNSVFNKRAHRSKIHKSTFYKPKNEWIRVENTHEPLIDKNTWDIVSSKSKAVFTSKWKLEGKGRYNSNYLLTGVIKCADCGYNFNGDRSTFNDRHYHHYVCSGYNFKGKEFCNRSAIPRDEIEIYVQKGIERRLSSKRWRDHIKKQIKESLTLHKSRYEIRFLEIDQELKELSKRIRNTWDAISRGVDAVTGMDFLKDLKTRQDSLLEERHNLKKKIDAEINLETIYDTILGYFDEIPETLKHGNFKTRKEILKSFCPLIEVSQRNSFIKYHFRKVPIPPKPAQDTYVPSSMLVERRPDQHRRQEQADGAAEGRDT